MRAFKLIIFTVAALIMPLFAQGQTIEGAVFDGNGKVIEFANVVHVDSCMHYLAGTTTSSEGTFSLALQGRENSGYLIISYVGM